MKFMRADSEAAVTAMSRQVTATLNDGQRVLWLVCGGSNIMTEVKIMEQVRGAAPDKLGSLLILPMDERYGSPGHQDSNYRQLKDAGFNPGDALWIDVLARDLPLAETVDFYSELVTKALASAGKIFGLFGLGADGHTAGVLPGSPAVLETAASVVGYDSPPFVRMTLTPKELIKADAAYVLVYGETKKPALERLGAGKEDLSQLPAKLLYDIPEVYVYNDQVEEEK